MMLQTTGFSLLQAMKNKVNRMKVYIMHRMSSLKGDLALNWTASFVPKKS